MKLMLCSGNMQREGWTRLDANPERGADIIAKVPPLPAEVACQKWEAIELIHGITSFYPWEAAQLLREIRAALATGGKLILEQPNAAKCNPVNNPEWLFGDPQYHEPLHMNRWAYTPESLARLLTVCGYSNVLGLRAQYHDPGRDFRMEASI